MVLFGSVYKQNLLSTSNPSEPPLCPQWGNVRATTMANDIVMKSAECYGCWGLISQSRTMGAMPDAPTHLILNVSDERRVPALLAQRHQFLLVPLLLQMVLVLDFVPLLVGEALLRLGVGVLVGVVLLVIVAPLINLQIGIYQLQFGLFSANDGLNGRG